MKIKNISTLIFYFFIINCTYNGNKLINSKPVNELVSEWELYSVEMIELKSFFDYLLKEDVIDTLTTNLFTDKLNNWTWIFNEDRSFISIQQINGVIATNFGKWSQNSEFFISINGKKKFSQNDYYIIDNELIIDFKKDIKGYPSTIVMIFKRS